ncbi:helix-turn-helix transcriptional regulator [Streptomyces purpureus]|uniref:helix-turn-helix transcriptional regulator n=1 Tax=Streptomyces purpureus TaxID=1951 RepID=UPI000369428C|nr:helix-turn-helix domain-containing protein [Streptomyces purpureus]
MPRAKNSNMASPPSGDRLVTPAETARRLGISPGTLRNWGAAGKGPRRYRMSPDYGGRVRYSEHEVDAFIEHVKTGALARPPKSRA